MKFFKSLKFLKFSKNFELNFFKDFEKSFSTWIAKVVCNKCEKFQPWNIVRFWEDVFWVSLAHTHKLWTSKMIWVKVLICFKRGLRKNYFRYMILFYHENFEYHSSFNFEKRWRNNNNNNKKRREFFRLQ